MCVDGTCQTISCQNAGSCATNQVCLAETGTCASAECGCLDCDACPEGKSCVDGLCASDGCTQDSECDEGSRCDAGACVPCGPDGCGEPTGCTEGSCPAGQVCDAASKECVDPAAASACQVCANDGECGGSGWSCLPVGGAQVCLAPCGSGDDCQTGWTCWGGACTPAGYKCLGCTIDGCADGQVCDTNTGACVQPKADCLACDYDWECGAGNACHSLGAGVRVCVPRCSGEAACPGNSSCGVDPDSGYKVCTPAGSTCCFDADPNNCPDVSECTPACGGGTPHCKLGMCVECLADTDCGSGLTCNNNTWTCDGSTNGCTGATPYWSDVKQACVQCTESAHCGGDACNETTNTCENDLCASCVAPYPACTQVNGEFYCVQCTEDVHCGANGVCDVTTYSCQGGTVTPTDPCSSDSDCDASVSGFDLYCGGDSLCHDKDGGCDDVTAFCLNGNECTDLLALLAGGAGGLPELPGGGGSTLPGVCECTIDGGGLGIPLPFGPSKDCPDGVYCGNLFDILGGGGGQSTNVCGGGI